MDQFDVELTIEEGVTTWECGESQSTIDLTFISTTLANRLVVCERADDVQHDSDHFPIRTLLDIDTPAREALKRRNWKATNTKVLMESIDTNLVVPSLAGKSKASIELATTAFLATIRKAIEKSTPWANLCEWSNPDFSETCREAVKTTRYLRRQYSRTHSPWAWKHYCAAWNRKKRLINKELRLSHRRRVQEATEQGPQGLWKLAKWARTRSGAYEYGITPTLRNPEGELAETLESKARFFQEAFFPKAPPADLSDINKA